MRSAALTPRLSQIAATTARRHSLPLSVTKAPRQSRDAPILAELLELHAVAQPRIIDCTFGKGAIWGRLPIRASVVKVDIQPLPGLDLVADWRDLPSHYARGSFDVFVADPIFVADVGRTSTLYGRYVANENPVKGDSVAHLFPHLLDVAAYLVKPGAGVCLVKMCDQVHSGRYQWQVYELVAESQRRGWTACQRKIVPNAALGRIRDQQHKWKYHTRNECAEWIVLRNGPACHGPGRRLKHEFNCTMCGAKFSARRADARTCPGGRCRQRRHRAIEGA